VQKCYANLSGTADATFPTEEACLDHIKKLIQLLADRPTAGFNRIHTQATRYLPRTTLWTFPKRWQALRNNGFNSMFSRMLIAFNRTNLPMENRSVSGYARIEGWAVGIVVKSAKNCKKWEGRNANGWCNL